MTATLSEIQRRNWERPEVRKKHSETMKRLWLKPEYRAKLTASIKEACNRPEIKAKRRLANPMNRLEVRTKHREAHNTPEYRANLSERMKKALQNPEIRAKYNEAMNCPEAQAKRNESVKRFYEDPEHRANHREIMNRPEVRARREKTWNDPKYKTKCRESATRVMKRPDVKAKQKEAMNRPEVRAKFTGEGSPSWRGGLSFLPYCPKFNETRKEQVRNDYEHVCAGCGKSELLEGQRLAVHHVDGEKMQGCKGSDWFGLGKWFLVPLCLSCHAKGLERDLYSVGKFWLAELARRYWQRASALLGTRMTAFVTREAPEMFDQGTAWR